MSETEDEKFEETVAEFLSEGLHARRGLTAEEYTAVCRKAWDECQTSLAGCGKTDVWEQVLFHGDDFLLGRSDPA